MAVILANSAVHPGMTLGELPDVHYLEYMKWELAKALDDLSQWYDITFLPMSRKCYAYDEVMHMEVASRMVHGYKANHGTDLDAEDFVRTIGKYDMVVSMKFHGIIFPTIMGVPFVDIGLTRKTSLFCEENGLSDLRIEPYSFTKERLFSTIQEAEKPGVSERLREITKIKHDQWKVISSWLEAWTTPSG